MLTFFALFHAQCLKHSILTKDLNIASGYVSMNIDRTPTVKMGMPNGGRSSFAKFAKVTSTSGFGDIPNGGSCFYFLSRRGVRLISFAGIS